MNIYQLSGRLILEHDLAITVLRSDFGVSDSDLSAQTVGNVDEPLLEDAERKALSGDRDELINYLVLVNKYAEQHQATVINGRSNRRMGQNYTAL